ncbi:MAG: Calx-beta domain-containing protein [Prosthecobacter sp.]|nr:Calx-beta domain-containing protein [Prosthecobacter sp.]
MIAAGGAVTTVAGTGSAGASDGTGVLAEFNHPFGVALNSAATLLYVTDGSNQTIREITLPGGVVTTYAGVALTPDYVNGSNAAARFNTPKGIAVDIAGNVYVADSGNMVVRKISGGVVSTLAGDPTVPFLGGFNDGLPATARFSDLFAGSPFGGPCGLAVDGVGNVYVSDQGNPATFRGHTIRKITPAGSVTTLAGVVGSPGYADGTGGGAVFNYPAGIAVDPQGKLYVADAQNNRIRNQCRCTPIYEPQCFGTLAGSGTAGPLDGTGIAAEFKQPWGVAVAGDGTAFVADTLNHLIRKITPAGVVTTLAGQSGTPAFADGSATGARFSRPTGVAVNSAGTAVYVADHNNQRIRKIDLTQLATSATFVTTVAGSGAIGSSDGVGAAAEFNTPFGVALNSAASLLYVTDASNQTIREITLSTGNVMTYAGLAMTPDYINGSNAAARFNTPRGITVDSAGNVYVADNLVVRKLLAGGGGVITLAGDPLIAGLYGCTDGLPGTARFSPLFPFSPFGGTCGLAVDSVGNVYVSDQGNSIPGYGGGNTIRKITPAGFVTTLAGVEDTPGFADGTGTGAKFNHPAGLAIDSTGRLYVADAENNRIRIQCSEPDCVDSIFVSYNNGTLRKFDTSGTPTTFATGLSTPKGLAIKASFLYVANSGANAILQYPTSGGASTTFSSAGLSGPYGLTFDSAGDLYAANYTNSTIQRLDGATGVAVPPFPVTSPNMNGAFGIAIDAAGNIYAASHNNNTIQKFTAAGVFVSDFVPTTGGLSAPRGVAIRAGVLYVANYITSVVTMFDLATGTNMGDYATSADGLLNPVGIAFNDAGNLYVANAGNQNIMKFTAPHVGTLFSNIFNQSPDFIAIVCEPVVPLKALSFSKAGVSVNETEGTVTIPVLRTGALTGTVGVSYTTSSVGGTASVQDYTPKTAQAEWKLAWDDGQWTQNIIIAITPDMLVEKNETFTVTLSSPTGDVVLGSPASCKVSIIDPSALNPVADTQPPGVQVTSYLFPVGTFGTILASATTTIGVDSGSSITVSGTATDNKGVKMVEIRVITPGATPADFTPVTSDMPGAIAWPYIGPFYPISGFNVIELRATDFAGNTTTVSRNVKVLRPLLVSMNPTQGSPSFINYGSPIQGGTYREVGKTYTVIAKPKAGFVFDGWIVNNTTGTGITPFKQELPSLTFIFQEGLVLTANFIPNPFIAVAGNYNGLVRASPTEPAPFGTTPSVDTEGSFTAKVETTGAFTGKLTLNGSVLPVVGVFDNTGTARFGATRALSVSVPRAGRPNDGLVVALHLDLETPGTNDMITGSGKQYYRGGLAFLSDIQAFRAHYDGKTPATTVPDEYLGAAKSAGMFTAVIQTQVLANQDPVFTLNSEFPQGDGYATIKVSKAGIVTFTSTLADGSTPVTGSAALSDTNVWPLYAPLYNKLGGLLGNVALSSTNTESDMSATDMLWFRPMLNTQHYPYGWAEGIRVDLRAAKYAVTAGQSVLKSPDGGDPGNVGDMLPAADMDGNAALAMSDGLLSVSVNKAVNLSISDVVTKIPATNPTFTLTVNRATGIIGGTFNHSDGTKPKFQGIIYQKGTAAGAYGYFLSTPPKVLNYLGESGGVSLSASP